MEDYKLRQTGEEVQERLDLTKTNQRDIETLDRDKQDVLEFDVVPTEGSINPVTSGGIKAAIDAEKTRAEQAEQQNADGIADIEALVPIQATPQNQLADKQFVNSSIATNTGNFVGTFNTMEELEAVENPGNNDYGYVVSTDEQGNTVYSRYKYNATTGQWQFEYALNNSSFTAAEWAAIQSGITALLVEKLSGLPTNAQLQAALGNITTDVSAIQSLIPGTAAPQNQLADKAFVNSSISTATANFKGTFDTLAELEAVTGANANDYGFVRTTDSAGNTIYKRYKYVEGTGWLFEYELNNSSFTATQWAAIQSGITVALVAKLSSLPTNDELEGRLTAIEGGITDNAAAIEQEGRNRAQTDGELQDQLDAHGTRMDTAEQNIDNLETGLSDEETARQDADTALGQRISQNATDIQNEATARSSADTTLQQNIDKEETRAKGAEGTLDTRISNEISNRQQADTTLQANIDQEIANRAAADAALQQNIDNLEALIPSQATPQNQLADKEFVNHSIATNTANFVGTFDTLAELEAVQNPTNNDYGYVRETDAEGNKYYDRYKYNASTGAWAFEYKIESTPFTAAQWSAIQSGITAALVEKLSGLPNATELATQISGAITNALVSYSTTTEMNSAIGTAIGNALASYYTKTDIDSLIAGYYTKRQVDSAISSAISTALDSYYTKTEIDNLLQGYATTGALSSHTGNTTVHITAAERNAWNAKQAAITDGAQIGLGFGVSNEAATVQARTATIASFILLKNMPVTVRFTTAVNATNATLNISSTGAKPIYIEGAQMQPGIIKKDAIVTMIYDGTNWNIVQILSVTNAQSNLAVDMGLPSGRLWAIANIDVTKQSGFAEVDGKPSPFIYECTFFSWGNTEGHNPISDSAFSYDWGTGNDGPYAQTPGAQLTANAGLSFDAARAILGAPWRDPSTEDFDELFANIDYVQADGETVIDASQANKLVTVNGIVGIYLKSKINGRLLFFACSGIGYGQSWSYRGSDGYYWSRSLYSQAYGRFLYFSSGGVYPQYGDGRFYGFARRAVQ